MTTYLNSEYEVIVVVAQRTQYKDWYGNCEIYDQHQSAFNLNKYNNFVNTSYSISTVIILQTGKESDVPEVLQ